jgi:hypothetical protein
MLGYSANVYLPIRLIYLSCASTQPTIKLWTIFNLAQIQKNGSFTDIILCIG